MSGFRFFWHKNWDFLRTKMLGKHKIVFSLWFGPEWRRSQKFSPDSSQLISRILSGLVWSRSSQPFCLFLCLSVFPARATRSLRGAHSKKTLPNILISTNPPPHQQPFNLKRSLIIEPWSSAFVFYFFHFAFFLPLLPLWLDSGSSTFPRKGLGACGSVSSKPV